MKISNSERLLLASASPRRAELLTAAGFEFDVMPAHVDETVRDEEDPTRYVVRLAEHKARTVSALQPERLVLAADTTVVVDRYILGKPDDAADARRMLSMLSGRSHEVVTGVALARAGEIIASDVATTRVDFAELSPDEIDWYVSSSEPMDKAGAYAIQGVASRFVTSIDGSYSNVVGLPVSLVYSLVKRAARSR